MSLTKANTSKIPISVETELRSKGSPCAYNSIYNLQLIFVRSIALFLFAARLLINCGENGEIRDTKTLNFSRNIISLQGLGHVSRFACCVFNLSRNKNICCKLKKIVAKSTAWVNLGSISGAFSCPGLRSFSEQRLVIEPRVNLEQQILALLLVFHQTHNLLRNKFTHVARQVAGFSSSYSISFLELRSP